MRISDWSSDVCSSDLQLAGRSVIGEPPFVEQQHAVAAFGFVETGGRPDYGHPFVGQRLHHAPQILTADRIDTDTRIIEQQDSRPGHPCAGETQLPPPAEIGRAPGREGGCTYVKITVG